MEQKKKTSPMQYVLGILQGALIGLGAVLPGMSGGVLCVVFGIYKTVMEFLASPFRKFKTHFPKLLPIGIGGIIGVVGFSKILTLALQNYENQSVCLFIGLIVGMMPSLFREAGEKGRSKKSYISMVICMIVIFALLTALALLSVQITPNFGWYLFCGFSVALSIIAPGMSFSTLLMPLGLFDPFIEGLGVLDFSILLPAGIGGLATLLLLSKAVDSLFKKHYSVAFHGIVGIVIAATVMIIPFESFTVSVAAALINLVCIAVGIVASLLLDKFNQKYSVDKE